MSVKYFTIFNACVAGVMAGNQSGGAVTLNDPTTGDPVEPVNFATLLANAKVFATEVDTILQSAGSTTPANLAALVSDGATVVPASASVENASQSLPPAMSQMAAAMWGGRTPTGSTYADMANSLAAQFLEYCSGCQTV